MLVVEKFSAVRVLCVGDVMIDHFVEGDVKRISPESPVPVFSVESKKSFPGGAANVARNVAALGAHCTIIAVTGEDGQADALVASLLQYSGIRTEFIRCPGRPTTEKTRYVAAGQHLLRVDSEIASPLPCGVESSLRSRIADEVPRHDVLVLSDYSKGVLSDAVIHAAVRAAARAGIPTVADPKSRDLSRYAGATVITPNAKEIEASTGLDPVSDDGAILAAAEAVRQAKTESVLVTRAAKGMVLARRNSEPIVIPSCAREVFDVVGAGDTVVATLSLALGSGHDMELAARTANVAAGIVVGRRGTSTVSQSELIGELGRLGQEASGVVVTKILKRDELARRIQSWKNDGLRVGFTNGCFDILHLGHIRLLRFCRDNCDRLIVGLNGDKSTRRLKGPGRPLNAETDRAEILAALDMVDGVVVFDDETPRDLIELTVPNVLIKGADYALDAIVGADFVSAHGGAVLRCDLLPGKSSTELIRKGTLTREALA